MSSAATMLAVARSQVGPCPGKTNKYSAWYGMPGQAWCAMFVSWVAAQSFNADVVPKHAYTPTGAAWFKARGQWVSRFSDLRPGDIAYWNFNCGRICHVGIVDTAPSGGGAWFIEGNTSGASQANGGCVQRKWRSATYFAGAGRPAYGSSSNPIQKDWLERGDTGAGVGELQQALINAGFSVGPHGVDNVYGNDTFSAVVAYQISRGLEPDGVAGVVTRTALATGKPAIRRNADGSLTIDEDGIRGAGTISRWQEVMGTPIDGKITKLTRAPSNPREYLIGRDQAFLNSVVSSEHIRNLTGKASLVVDAVEGPSSIKVRQFYLFNRYAQERLGRPARASDFDGINGVETNTLHQYALNQATSGSGRY